MNVKKIKVTIKDSIGSYSLEGKIYLAGDTLTVTEAQFIPYIMDKVEPKPVIAQDEPEPLPSEDTVIISTSDEIPTEEPTTAKPEPKSRSRRTKRIT